MRTPNNVIEISGERHRIKMELQHRDFPEANDYWDGNWVTTHFWLDVPGMPTLFTDSLHLGDLLRFEQELARLRAEQQGQAVLAMVEEYFRLEAILSVSGSLHWHVTARIPVKRHSDNAILPALTFDFASDSSELLTVQKQVKAVLTQFPIKSPRT